MRVCVHARAYVHLRRRRAHGAYAYGACVRAHVRAYARVRAFARAYVRVRAPACVSVRVYMRACVFVWVCIGAATPGLRVRVFMHVGYIIIIIRDL